MKLPRLLLAIALALAPLAATAVYVNAEGTGDILIFPYFTAQDSEGNAFNTYVSVVNDSIQPKALRVRLREGRNGRELAGFNLLLGTRDTWTAAIAPTPLGARLLSADASCVAPALNAGPQPSGGVAFLDLSSADYSGARDDGLGGGPERVREGYVEIFEMATFDTVPSCANFQAFTVPAASVRAPSGQLSGTLTLINVQSGLDFTVNPVALADAATQAYFRAPADPYPDYNVAEIAPVAGSFTGGQTAQARPLPQFYRGSWNTPLDAVNAVLLAESSENELVMDRATRSGTDMVVTMPTRRLAGSPPNPPFWSGLPASSAIDVPLSLGFFPRDGEQIGLSTHCDFCPVGSENPELRLRWASSVLSFRPALEASTAVRGISDVLGSRNGVLVNLRTPAENGYVSIRTDGSLETQFPRLHTRTSIETGAVVEVRPTYFGLPVVGFIVRTFRNGNLACTGSTCQGNYGGAFPNRQIRRASQ